MNKLKKNIWVSLFWKKLCNIKNMATHPDTTRDHELAGIKELDVY